MSVEKNTIEVKLTEVRRSADGLMRVYFSRLLNGVEKNKKIWNGAAIVSSKSLLSRLEKVKKGAEITIETETDWEAEGMPVFLTEFWQTRVIIPQSKKTVTNSKTSESATIGKIIAH